MEKWYTCHFDEQHARSEIAGRDDSDRIKKGKEGFSP